MRKENYEGEKREMALKKATTKKLNGARLVLAFVAMISFFGLMVGSAKAGDNKPGDNKPGDN
ncbi:MAG TPA: hypothetical protein VKJ45_19005, partial [Blastocatellia bacterium]|nr:hypothetical protein [Blastocatellia bacterium]